MVSEPRVFRQTHFVIPSGSTEILLVRHGESMAYVEGVAVEKLGGHDNPHLAPQGQLEAERLGERLSAERVDAIYVTSLCRTTETAEPLSRKTGIPIEVVAELREVHMGEWEGVTFRQRLADQHPLAVKMRREQRWDHIPGSEDAETFRARIRVGIERIASAHPDGRVVAVTHAGTISTIVAMATGARPFAFLASNNGSISSLVVTGTEWQVRTFNDTSHLREGDW
jgi:probable phosphoglycerate mutase